MTMQLRQPHLSQRQQQLIGRHNVFLTSGWGRADTKRLGKRHPCTMSAGGEADMETTRATTMATTTGIHTAVIVLSVLEWRKTTRVNQQRSRQQQR